MEKAWEVIRQSRLSIAESQSLVRETNSRIKQCQRLLERLDGVVIPASKAPWADCSQ